MPLVSMNTHTVPTVRYSFSFFCQTYLLLVALEKSFGEKMLNALNVNVNESRVAHTLRRLPATKRATRVLSRWILWPSATELCCLHHPAKPAEAVMNTERGIHHTAAEPVNREQRRRKQTQLVSPTGSITRSRTNESHAG